MISRINEQIIELKKNTKKIRFFSASEESGRVNESTVDELSHFYQKFTFQYWYDRTLVGT